MGRDKEKPELGFRAHTWEKRIGITALQDAVDVALGRELRSQAKNGDATMIDASSAGQPKESAREAEPAATPGTDATMADADTSVQTNDGPLKVEEANAGAAAQQEPAAAAKPQPPEGKAWHWVVPLSASGASTSGLAGHNCSAADARQPGVGTTSPADSSLGKLTLTSLADAAEADPKPAEAPAATEQSAAEGDGDGCGSSAPCLGPHAVRGKSVRVNDLTAVAAALSIDWSAIEQMAQGVQLIDKDATPLEQLRVSVVDKMQEMIAGLLP